MSTTKKSAPTLPKLPKNMNWHIRPNDPPQVRLRYHGKHVGYFDTLHAAIAARETVAAGLPWPPVVAPVAPTPGLPAKRVAPVTSDAMYRAFSKAAYEGRFASQNNRRYARSTLVTYHYVWERHCNPRFGALPFAALDRPFVTDAIHDISAESGREVALKARSALQSTARFALDKYGSPLYLQIATQLQVPDYQREDEHESVDRIIQPDELLGLLEGCAMRDAHMKRSLILPAVVLLVKHGLRPSEALSLPLGRGALDLEAGVAHIRTSHVHDPDEQPAELLLKTADSRRDVPLGSTVIEALRQHVAHTGARPGDLVFRMPKGTPVSVAVLRNDLARAAALGGLALPTPVPYDMRRTYVSYAFAAGIQEAPLAKLLGHKHGGSLARQRYAQALKADVANVAGTIDAFLDEQSGGPGPGSR